MPRCLPVRYDDVRGCRISAAFSSDLPLASDPKHPTMGISSKLISYSSAPRFAFSLRSDAFQYQMRVRDPQQVVADAGGDFRKHLRRKADVLLFGTNELAPVAGQQVACRARLIVGPDPIQRHQFPSRL